MHNPKTLLDWGSKTYVMGIINITLDSFSGDGLLNNKDFIKKAIEQAHKFIEDGADILDVGGESTRPGAVTVDVDEEVRRVVPIIEALNAERLNTIISVDTYKSSVAEAAIEAGAHWVNDIWGLRADPNMAPTVSKLGVPVIIMHNNSKAEKVISTESLGGRYTDIHYDDLISEVIADLRLSIDLAHNAGILDQNIIIDPGLGFGKTVSQSLELINNLDKLKTLGYPILVGTSRKSFVGYTLNKPPNERLAGTSATVSVSILRGADIVRVHDVKEMVQVARMTDAIMRA